MTIEFEKFQPGKVLPTKMVDFVLRDPQHGIKSPEFMAAVDQGDIANILEGIDSIILNAETRLRTRLTRTDKFRLQMLAQDAIIDEVLRRAERKSGTVGRSAKLNEVTEHISRTNLAINQIFNSALKETENV